MKKSLIAILMTAVMLLPLIAPLMTVEAATDPSDWYMTVPGVLDTDYYKLYPYETNASLTIGFSKFGELINSATNVGLEYAAVDPFAPPAGSGLTAQVPKRDWLQGWFINITYHHRTLGDRNVWAMAVHSDAIDYGNDWIRVDFPNDHSTSMGFTNNKFNEDPRCVGYLIYGTGTYGVTAVNGGRKTNGTCVTAPIKVLYNGPREFIAECRTTIYDHPIYGSNSTASDIGLVQVVITVLFDKVKKEVTLLKDVKSLLPLKEGEEMKIEFSNRGEVDLGTDAASYGSYGHFYTEGTAEWDTEVYGGEIDEEDEGLYTCYGYNWEIIQTEDPLDTDYPGFSAAGPFPQSSDAGTFDVAQAINERAGYVWYGAFWPSLSDWSIDGWDQWWHSLHVGDPHYIDYRNPDDEPNFVPFYIGEWDFVLRNTADALNRTQFRGVTQYGVVYQHDAEDEAMFDGEGDNVIDREVWYYLDETFNPWSLDDAVDKYTRRWVEWKVSGTSYTTKRAPVLVVDADEWDQYAMFADRVYRVDTGKLLNRYQGDYTLTYNSATGTATFSGLPTAKCKILYSTEPYWERSGTVNSPSAFHTYSNVAPGTEINFTYTNSQTLSKDPLGVIHSYEFTVWMGVKVQPTVGADFSATTDDPDLDDVKRDFLVNPEYPMTTTYYFWDNETFATSNLVMTSISLEPTNLLWTINSAGANESVYIETLDIRLNLKATVSYNITESELNVTFAPYMGYYYEEDLMGCYEWAEVGRDAASVDSVGLALVSEAFDSIKGIPTGIAGADMDNPVVANQMPFVMNKFGAGTSKADYKDALGRAALNDDWCTYWPVASSNMIGVGGPLANLLAYYANDFTTAMYGLSPYAGTGPYLDMIVPVTCWDKAWPTTDGLYHLYSSSSSTGYAVISTYLDINGTELFMVWGGWGRDTYYASQWLHGDVARNIPPGIVQLQDAPCGATSIILKIDYTDPKHPTFSIVEVLGTISETLWVHNSEYKGGIHDP
jgi:hypothetical protein